VDGVKGDERSEGRLPVEMNGERGRQRGWPLVEMNRNGDGWGRGNGRRERERWAARE
jgi:hypothetical protein